MVDNIDGELADWATIRASGKWRKILIGNGASRAIWRHFRYESLFKLAAQANSGHRLDKEDERLFAEFETTNFEQVLAHLTSAGRCARALGGNSDCYQVRRKSIKAALVEAVRTMHVPWYKVAGPVLAAVRKEMLNYDVVFTTNYDLLLYWAVMEEKGSGFKDMFWSDGFDPLDTELWGRDTQVLFLHGGLHLYKNNRGQTIKRTKEDGKSLLELFGEPMADGAEPLFVAEGDPDEKLCSIRQSDYLSFAYSQLGSAAGGLVIFGHSLSGHDRHIVDAINKRENAQKVITSVAVGIQGGDKRRVIAQKAHIINLFPDLKHVFFDAATHPLGAPSLEIKP